MMIKIRNTGRLLFILWLMSFSGIATLDYVSTQNSLTIEIVEAGDLEEPDSEENKSKDDITDKFITINNTNISPSDEIVNRIYSEKIHYTIFLKILGPPPDRA